MLSKGPLNPILSGVPENHLASGHVNKYSASLFQLAKLTACYRIFLSNTWYAFSNICGVLPFSLQSSNSLLTYLCHIFFLLLLAVSPLAPHTLQKWKAVWHNQICKHSWIFFRSTQGPAEFEKLIHHHCSGVPQRLFCVVCFWVDIWVKFKLGKN